MVTVFQNSITKGNFCNIPFLLVLLFPVLPFLFKSAVIENTFIQHQAPLRDAALVFTALEGTGVTAGSLLEALTCQCKEKAPGHSLHDTASGQGCREGVRLGSGGPHLPWGRARAPITRVHLYEVVLGKLLTSLSSFTDDNASVSWSCGV